MVLLLCTNTWYATFNLVWQHMLLCLQMKSHLPDQRADSAEPKGKLQPLSPLLDLDLQRKAGLEP